MEIHQTESNYRRKIERDSIKIYEFHLLNPTHVLPDFFYANNNFNHSRLEKYRFFLNLLEKIFFMLKLDLNSSKSIYKLLIILNG